MLDGLNILDATDRLGWLAGRLLADLGAAVTKIEAPGADTSAAEWRALNVNKTLVELDLERLADRERFDALAAKSDILLATPVPGTAAAQCCESAASGAKPRANIRPVRAAAGSAATKQAMPRVA